MNIVQGVKTMDKKHLLTDNEPNMQLWGSKPTRVYCYAKHGIFDVTLHQAFATLQHIIDQAPGIHRDVLQWMSDSAKE